MEIIAEIGQNHDGDMVLAKELIYAAKECGADVAKFQLFDAISTFPPKESNPWLDYNCKTELTRDNIQYLYEICQEVDIEFMCSAFDSMRVSWLENINVKRHKIASRSIRDIKLIDTIAQTNKEAIVSLGMWQETEFPKLPVKNSRFLYCVSKYPTPLEDFNFLSIDFIKDYAGFSDHSIGIEAASIALSRGAQIIEKHFTLDKKRYGPDHEGSMSPKDLTELCLFKSSLKKTL